MDAKLQEDLFRRYVVCLERRLEDGGGNAGLGGSTLEGGSEALLSTATALLGAYQPDPGQRFRMVRFYEVVENAIRCLRGCSLQGLERAFLTLETLCTNLLLFPWKKEFRCIKTFTGPYVYLLQSAVCDADLRSLLRSMGYSRDHELQFHVRDHPGGPAHLRQLAFELFLAQAECRLLGEVVALARGSASELEALEQRRGCRDDAAGCAEVLRRRDSLGADMARLSEPLPVPDFFPIQSLPSVDAYSSYHLSSLDEIDLYTERGGPRVGGRQTPSRPPSREPRDARDGWALKTHSGLTSPGVKCQGCGLGCSSLASCPRCEMILCQACHDIDPSPCCGLQDYPNPKSPRPVDGYLPVKEKLSSVAMSSAMVANSDRASLGGSRCGFCNKPGASHTCVNCSKVSCDMCMSLYAKDVCTRKKPQHSFVPNHQLNFKSGTISHLVYR
ncbi:unnamed protein product [Oncorhynchus mykiss]|uniref:Spermatogenesis-associated protein 2 PUB-like domain-containing protein n=1 Tax=Oncorhynchus mykiss TaxID=8022 RepID=A0A060Y3T7_ONCMY|nr:unnamed protein product [Oncorhynchus mykiss]